MELQERRLLSADEFQSTLSAVLSPGLVDAPDGFRAQLRSIADHRVSVGRLSASAHHASGGLTKKVTSGLIQCNYQISGQVRLQQGDRRVQAGPGDFWWFWTDRPYELTFESDLELVGVAAPPERVPLLQGCRSTSVSGRDPAIAALGVVVERLEDQIPGLSATVRLRFIAHILDSIDTMGRQAAAQHPEDQPPRTGVDLVGEALDYIQGELHSAELSPESVARALHVSLRSLHRAFEQAKLSVSMTIRSQRLERCHRDLADPALASVPVAAIGAKWGLTSPSHFSALFRAAYDATPTEYRRAANPA